MTQPIGVILAGGLARRMGGGDKALLDIGGQSILSRVIARIEPQVSDLAINANGDASRFADYGLPVIADTAQDFPGPLAGILAGMDWGQALGAEYVLTVAADTPFFPTDIGQRLQDMRGELPIAIAATADGRHPTFGLWPTALAEDLRTALDDGVRKVVAWADSHGAATVPFNDETAFFNVNTPEDLAHAETHLI
ncbi:MAG: molybdenum cofactor guanylyltransferase MobA [Pseudomonadota bacterium]